MSSTGEMIRDIEEKAKNIKNNLREIKEDLRKMDAMNEEIKKGFNDLLALCQGGKKGGLHGLPNSIR
jgi:dsDNA-specific endonuclease/ATPase MutS2